MAGFDYTYSIYHFGRVA